MHPYLAHVGPIVISSYGVAAALAFLLTVTLARRATAGSLRGLVPLDDAALVDWAVWAVLGGLLGGRLLYVLMNWPAYADQPLEIIALWHGGLIWYGGFAGGVLGTLWFFRLRRCPSLRGLDQVVPFVAAGHAVGRIGCFLNGCCYGKPASSWIGVRMPGLPSPVVPTQLLESASLVALYVLLRRLQRPALLRRPGIIFGGYLAGYALIRWTIEWWRANQPVIWDGWTQAQAVSLVACALGIGLIVRALRRKPT